MNAIIKYFKIRLILLKASIIYTFRLETAFFWNGWTNVFSTVAYTALYILFIDIIYGSTDSIAGYSENEMYFFFFCTQIVFYISFMVFSNITQLNIDINRGNLDTILTKPVPALFYLMYRNIPLLSSIRDGLAPLLVAIVAVNWAELDISFIEGIAATITAIAGIITFNCVIVLSVIPVFWLGEGESIIDITMRIAEQVALKIPFEGFNTGLRTFFITVFPLAIGAGLTSSIALGKSDPYIFTSIAVISAIGLNYVTRLVWDKGLRAYSSASS